MTEESLTILSVDELLDVMVKSVNELLAINKVPQNKSDIKQKQKEVELIQRVIAEKKAYFSPR